MKLAQLKGHGARGGVATDSILLLFVKCLVAVVRIAQTAILSRCLTLEQYGTYSQALLVISLFAPIFSLGLDSAVNYFFNRVSDPAERVHWANTVVGLSVGSGLVGAALLLVFRDAVASYYRNAAVAGLMLFIALRPMLQNLTAVYQNLYVSSGMSSAIAVRNLVVAVAQVGVIAVASVFIRDLVLLFALLLLLDVFQLLALSGYFSEKRFKVRPWRIDRADVRPVLAYAVPMLLATSVSMLAVNFDRLLLSGLMSVEDFALFSNMAQELPFGFVISSFTAVVTPAVVKLLSNREMGAFRRLWGDYVELGYTVTWPLCATALAVAPQLIEVLYSNAYLSAEGVAVFRVYTLSAAYRFTYFGLVLTALGESRLVFMYSLFTMILSVPLTFLLYRAGGMVGASAASVIAYIVPSMLYFKRGCRLTGVRATEVFRPQRVFVLLLETGFLTVLAAMVAPMFDGAFLGCVVGAIIVCGGVYLLNLRRILILVGSMNAIRMK